METPTCPQCGAPAGAEPGHRCSPRSELAPTVKKVEPTAKQKRGPERSATPSAAKNGVSKVAPKTIPKPDASAALRKAADAPPPDLERLKTDPTKVVNHYVLAGMLGQGGMGQVWK